MSMLEGMSGFQKSYAFNCALIALVIIVFILCVAVLLGMRMTCGAV